MQQNNSKSSAEDVWDTICDSLMEDLPDDDMKKQLIFRMSVLETDIALLEDHHNETCKALRAKSIAILKSACTSIGLSNDRGAIVEVMLSANNQLKCIFCICGINNFRF